MGQCEPPIEHFCVGRPIVVLTVWGTLLWVSNTITLCEPPHHESHHQDFQKQQTDTNRNNTLVFGRLFPKGKTTSSSPPTQALLVLQPLLTMIIQIIHL